ncbi:hypothetical protein [Listeria rustica]|uniref:Uncharacterized protein n=1 Tax=Listeria rustica TaxID=2713503 RepID=A0A7W1YGF7_9LIST|nr:hypothetical protein [Listeria rustica]MBA3926584.1 hypothetical protein [Listeria rustica]
MSIPAFSATIAGISLFISIFTLWKNRKRIEVYFDDIRFIEKNVVTLRNPSGETDTFDSGYKCSIKVINLSPNDIAYFDLRAFPTESNINFYLLTQKSLHPAFKDSRIYEVHNEGKSIIELEIPEKNHGLFKGNSFTHFDIFITDSGSSTFSDDIALSFKVPKKAFIKDPYAVTKRNKYKVHGIVYKINDPESQEKHK